MKRYLDDTNFEKFANDFQFLFKIIKNSGYELDLRLRDNYFNIYYKGNSLAKVEFLDQGYKIAIHSKFVNDESGDFIFAKDSRFAAPVTKGYYEEFVVDRKAIHPFFQKKYLDKICSNISKVNNGEEITFEQLLITDNSNREDFIIIDRQVTDHILAGKRMDLLALKKVKDNEYNFVILEVKLGNNKELAGKVANQLDAYVKHIDADFQDWKDSYEKTYSQMREAGLFGGTFNSTIKISKPVQGLVVVGGYSGIAAGYMANLKTVNSSLLVKQFRNLLYAPSENGNP